VIGPDVPARSRGVGGAADAAPPGGGRDRGQLPPDCTVCGFLSTITRRRRERLPHLITKGRNLSV
jgi:hypothetical protein